MTVRIDRWFGVPPELIAGEFLEKMSPSDFVLCIVLYWWSDRKSSRRFEVKDVEMEARTRLSRRALLDARKHLSDLGIAVITKTPGGHEYTLCDLKTGLPYPGDPKAKLNWSKKGANGNAARVEVGTTPSIAQGGAVRAGIAKTQELDPSWRGRGAVNGFDVHFNGPSSLPPKTDYGFDAIFNVKTEEPQSVDDCVPF